MGTISRDIFAKQEANTILPEPSVEVQNEGGSLSPNEQFESEGAERERASEEGVGEKEVQPVRSKAPRRKKVEAKEGESARMSEVEEVDKMGIIERIFHIQQAFQSPKNQRAEENNFSYRTAEDMVVAVKPLLDKYKCILYFTSEIIALSGECYLKMTATLTTFGGETFSTSSMVRNAAIQGMSIQQASGATETYAKKYALGNLLAVDNGQLDIDVKSEAKMTEDELADYILNDRQAKEGQISGETPKTERTLLEEGSSLWAKELFAVLTFKGTRSEYESYIRNRYSFPDGKEEEMMAKLLGRRLKGFDLSPVGDKSHLS